MKLEIGGFNDDHNVILTPLDREIFFLTPDGYLNLSSQITNLPSNAVDHLVKFFRPNFGSLFSNATGNSITLGANLHILKDKSKIQLSATGPDFDLQFFGTLKQNHFFLTQPSICRVNLRPSFVTTLGQLIAPNYTVSIDQQAEARVEIDRLSTPLNFTNFNLSNLSCNAQFQVSPFKFIGNNPLNRLQLEQVKGNVETFDLTENLSLHLHANAKENDKRFSFRLDGDLKKILENASELNGLNQLQCHILAQTKELPTRLALLALRNTRFAQELLGPSLNLNASFQGSLQNADIAMDIEASRLCCHNLQFKLRDENLITLQKPTSLDLRVTPGLAKKTLSSDISILHPFKVEGALKQLEASFKDRKVQLHQLDTGLNFAPYEFVLGSFKPFKIQKSQVELKSNHSGKLQTCLSAQFELPKDLPFYAFSKEITAECQMEDFISFLKGNSTLIETKVLSDDWSSVLHAKLNKNLDYQVLNESSISLPELKLKHRSGADITLEYFNLLVKPISLNLAKLQLNQPSVEGLCTCQQLRAQKQEALAQLQNLQVPFFISKEQNYIELKASSKNQIEDLNLKIERVFADKRLTFKSAIYHLDANLYNFDSKFINLFQAEAKDFGTILGNRIDAKINSTFSLYPDINGSMDCSFSSKLVQTNANVLIVNNMVSLQNELNFEYVLTPSNYKHISSWLSESKHHMQLSQNATFRGKLSKLKTHLKTGPSVKNLAIDGFISCDQFSTDLGSFCDATTKINSSDIAQNIKLDFSAETHFDRQKGQAVIRSELTNLLNEDQTALNKDLSGTVSCKFDHIATSLMHDLVGLYSAKSQPYIQSLGNFFDLDCGAQFDQGRGTLRINLDSDNIKTQLTLNLEEDQLSLKEDLLAKISNSHSLLTPFLATLNPLYQNGQCQSPICIKIFKENFSLPTTKLDLSKVNLEKGIIFAEHMHVSHNSNLDNLSTLLNQNAHSPMDIWSSPIGFSLQNGVLSTELTQMKINNHYEIALWGCTNLKQEKSSYYLAIPEQTLSSCLNLSQLPQSYYLQIPLSGKTQQAEGDWATATAQLCLINASTDTPQLAQFLLQTQPVTSIPPQLFKAPWKYKAEKKVKPKAEATDDEQSQFLHLFIDQVKALQKN